MRKLITILLFGCVLAAWAQVVQTPVLHLWDKPLGGLFNKFLSHNIPDHYFQDCSNVFFDEDLSVVRRGGFSAFNSVGITTSSVRFMDEYTKTDGSRYIIAVASHTLAYTSTGTFVNLISTINWKSTIWGANYKGNYYIGGNRDDSWEFDGAVIRSTGIPQCKYVLVDKDKFICANLTTAGDGSKIVYSRVGKISFEGDAYIYFNRSDGEDVTALASYNGNVYAFKPHSIGVLVGIDDDSPGVEDGIITLSKGIGCLYGSTIQTKDNMLIFQSHRGIEGFDGTNLILLSEPIAATMKNLSSSYLGTRQLKDSTASDFGAGAEYLGVSTGTPLTAMPISNVNNTLCPETKIKVDSLGNPHILYRDDSPILYYSSWTATKREWTTSIVDSTLNPLYLSMDLDALNNPHISYYDDVNDNLIYASYTANNVWAKTNVDTTGNVGYYTDIAIDGANNPHIVYGDITNTGVKYSSYTITSKTWATQTITNTGTLGQYNSIDLDSAGNAHVVYWDNVLADLYYSSFTVTKGWSAAKTIFTEVDGLNDLVVNNSNDPLVVFSRTGYYVYFSSFTAATQDWSLNVPMLGQNYGRQLGITKDSLGAPYVYACNFVNETLDISSFSSTSWRKWVIDSSSAGSANSLDLYNSNPMFSYRTEGGLTFYTGYCYYKSAQESAASSDGEYTFYNWGSYQATDFTPANTQTKYYVFTANTQATLGVSSVAVISGQQIVSNLQPWVQYKIIWNITGDPAIAPYVSESIINFNTTESIYYPCTIVKDRRYWYSVAESPSIVNNTVLVLDKQNNWTKFTQIKARSFTYFNNEIYFGSSDDTGLIYQYSDDFTTDTSSSIPTMIQTKDFDLGSRLLDKVMATDGLWISAEPTNIYSTMTVTYQFDKSTFSAITVDVSLTPDSVYPNLPIVEKVGGYQDRFKYVNFKITNFNKFNGLDLFYETQPIGNK